MGKRGPKPFPAQLHLLHGDPSKLGRPKLAALLDDTVRPPIEIPRAPRTLSREAREEWHRVAPHLAALGLVTQLDRAALAGYCTAWGEYVWAERRIAEINRGDRQEKDGTAEGEHGRVDITPSGYQQISVLMQIRNRALEIMAKFLAEFGLSPADRTRVARSDCYGLPGFEPPRAGGWAESGD